jgi:hypothetical protein
VFIAVLPVGFLKNRRQGMRRDAAAHEAALKFGGSFDDG